MLVTTDDVRVRGLRPLIPPAILLEELPLSDVASRTVADARRAVTEVLHGLDDRLLVIVGPCSIHDPAAALEYGDRLGEAARRLADDLLVVMRVYFEKPRTTVGWKGLINDPDLDDTFAINRGLRLARRLLLDLGERGVPAATEFLDTVIPQFLADLVSWSAIGARTTESQGHRELASGLSMPVGFKNGTDGSVLVAVDAVRAARHPHHFIGVTKQGVAAIVSTQGNEDVHIILRGSHRGPNYSRQDIAAATRMLSDAGLPGRVLVDCSHGNSQKDHNRQPRVAEEIASQLSEGSRAVFGVMLESHLVAGRQDVRSRIPLCYGQSITDACIGWEETLPVLHLLAQAARARRARPLAQARCR